MFLLSPTFGNTYFRVISWWGVFACIPFFPSVLVLYHQSILMPLLLERSWRITIAVTKAIGPWVLIETYYSMPLTQQAGHADSNSRFVCCLMIWVVMPSDVIRGARIFCNTLLYLFRLPYLILFIFQSFVALHPYLSQSSLSNAFLVFAL